MASIEKRTSDSGEVSYRASAVERRGDADRHL